MLCFVVACRPAIFLVGARPIVEKMAASRDGMKHNNILYMQTYSFQMCLSNKIATAYTKAIICTPKIYDICINLIVKLYGALTDASSTANAVSIGKLC